MVESELDDRDYIQVIIWSLFLIVTWIYSSNKYISVILACNIFYQNFVADCSIREYS